MHRVTVKIDRVVPGGTVARGVTPEDKFSSELIVQATGRDAGSAMDKAIRILLGERDAYREAEEVKKTNPAFEDDDDEE